MNILSLVVLFSFSSETMSVKSPLELVLYCYFNMPTINKTDLILYYNDLLSMFPCFILHVIC